MRLFPPVTDGSQRIVPVGSGGRVIGDRLVLHTDSFRESSSLVDVGDCSYLPEGTITTVHLYSIQRDARNFAPLPDSFWPERWLHATEGARSVVGMKLVHNSTAFFPFSYGPANCAGKGLALQEMRMVVSAMMQRLELVLADGFDAAAYENDMHDYLILSRPPLPVIVKQRKVSLAEA